MIAFKLEIAFKVEIALKEESASEEGIAQKEEVIFQEILFMEEIVVQQSEVAGFVIESFQGGVKGGSLLSARPKRFLFAWSRGLLPVGPRSLLFRENYY